MGRGKRGASSELVAKGVLVRVLGRSRRVSSDVETMWVTTTFRSLPPIVPSRREWRDVRVKPRTLRSAHTTGITRAAEYDMVAKARASVGRVACKKEWCGSDAAQRTKSLLAPKYQVVIRFPRRFPRSVKASSPISVYEPSVTRRTSDRANWSSFCPRKWETIYTFPRGSFVTPPPKKT